MTTTNDFTPAQTRIIDAIAESENGIATIENGPGVLSTCKALAAKSVIEFETTEDGIVVNLVPETKGKRPVWDLVLARNADGEPCATNEEGQLAEVPVNFPKGHASLLKGQFTETALWFEWKAELCRQRSAAQLDKAEDWMLKAKVAREGDTPEALLAKIRARRERMLAKMDADEQALLAQIGSDADLDDESDED